MEDQVLSIEQMKMTKLYDCNGKNIPYNAPIRFCWWYRGLDGSEHEYFYKAKIRKRKSGDILNFTRTKMEIKFISHIVLPQ